MVWPECQKTKLIDFNREWHQNKQQLQQRSFGPNEAIWTNSGFSSKIRTKAKFIFRTSSFYKNIRRTLRI